ncbi:hypothetical protein SALB_02713 [Streptomyces noursei]|uniref:Uncharacterized protein n=1 Tax=Streptomyces noursei TaxID=1971 RepID=A0A401QXA0_STRNR|nr:hypothetical protein SALB_02713 [Streptomyces noursei]
MTLTTTEMATLPRDACPTRSTPLRTRCVRAGRRPGRAGCAERQHARPPRPCPTLQDGGHARVPYADRGRVAPGPRGPHSGSTASPTNDAAIAGRFTANDLLPFPAHHLVKLSCAAGCTVPADPSRTARHPAASSAGETREEDRNDQQRQRAGLRSGAVAPAGASGSSASAWARRSWRRPGRNAGEPARLRPWRGGLGAEHQRGEADGTSGPEPELSCHAAKSSIPSRIWHGRNFERPRQPGGKTRRNTRMDG